MFLLSVLDSSDLCYSNISGAYTAIALWTLRLADHYVIHLLPVYKDFAARKNIYWDVKNKIIQAKMNYKYKLEQELANFLSNRS